MKKLIKTLAVLGILLVIYSVVFRFVSETSIGLGLVRLSAGAGLTMANSLMLIALLLKSWDK